MFSSLLRRKQQTPRRRVHDRGDPFSKPQSPSPSPGPASRSYLGARHATADFTEADDDDEDDSIGEDELGPYQDDPIDEDGTQRVPILPLFSASYLDSLPIYSITHAIRIIVQARTETTLSWDQLRSPQEGQTYPGNAGTSSTRAKVCELLALKLLKEYSTRELIDVLSYDFYPLQGLPGIPPPGSALKRTDSRLGFKTAAGRTSTLEVAIRASAKHFLAHPLVVQHLEAIWNGAISFYSAADSLHREVPAPPVFADPKRSTGKSDVRTPLLGSQSSKDERRDPSVGRRTVTLYDPRQASLFKLSRLRVPRSTRITTLELVFWFWSAGFMLDELVGFNEQGFSLYIMSFWNIFDLGILILLIVYYCMRGYGVFLVDPHHWNQMAYDVLAANAILLLPRIFSVLDHYPYFSQLLIAFRLMALDLAAVTVLVLISCSGFFVFFTMSQTESDPAEVAYSIFQILMGFTPAAWQVWPTYNWLAKALMVLFLIISHFVVVTILITVLTNSFMAIASNATEEHQFLFAINTISMVKNDALFSYVAPTNIFAWLLMPLRYCMPLKHFVWLNRLVIKATHFPLLFCIFFYERYWLASSMFEPTDLVENPGHGRPRTISFADPASRTAVFSPNIRVREESVVGFQKDHALEEVFRRVPDLNTLRSQRRNERRKTQNAIRTWMDQHDEEGTSPVNWPTLGSHARGPEWSRRFSLGRDLPHRLRQVSDVRSAASDPADLISNNGMGTFARGAPRMRLHPLNSELRDLTDADGDDELVTNDEEDEDNVTNTGGTQDGDPSESIDEEEEEEDYFTTPMASRFHTAAPSSFESSSQKSAGMSPKSTKVRRGLHSRTLSTNTILYNPQLPRLARSSSSAELDRSPLSRQALNRNLDLNSPNAHETRSPRRSLYMANRSRPVVAQKATAQPTTPRAIPRVADPISRLTQGRRLSSIDTGPGSENTNLLLDDPNIDVPGSFQTQMAMAMMKQGGAAAEAADRDRMGRLVLARMKTLEESFADVVKEMRELKSATAPPTRRNSASEGGGRGVMAMIEIAGKDRRRKTKNTSGAKKKAVTSSRRPASSGSGRAASAEGSGKDKGKGKAVALSSDSSEEGDAEDNFAEERFTRRGSSF
ncbi:hypothetical protein jhhlp_003855 [Lomentospora prolificans]|uniref:Calcium channel YVC1-like C-terminal transmembrane domain-containing protein n=1 Tax=Lomentospora prolificans TaxID=41688 RepID=A0A2N3N9Z7_9PEZI|nr:hypothetical protein jhhlp_003855 [Lomentospora prolificans]